MTIVALVTDVSHRLFGMKGACTKIIFANV